MSHILKEMLFNQKIAAVRLKAKNHVLKTSYNSTGGHNSIPYVYEWKDFLAKGLLWDFYCTTIGEDIALCFRTSSNGGLNWSAETDPEIHGYPEGISLYVAGDYIHVVKVVAETMLFYRRGFLNPDGTIVWEAETLFYNPFPDCIIRPTIAVDESGYAYVGYSKDTAGNFQYRPYVTKNSMNDGSWVTAPGYPRQLNATTSSAWRVKVLPRIGDNMIAIYLRTGFLYSQAYDAGVGWGAQQDWVFIIASSEYFDAVSDTQNGDIWMVATYASDAGRCIIVIIRHDDGSFSEDVVVDEEGTVIVFSTSICPGLCLNRISPTEVEGYIFWLGEPTANHVFFERVIGYVTELGYTDLATAIVAFQAKYLFQVTPHSDNTFIMLVYGTSATGRKLYSLTFEP